MSLVVARMRACLPAAHACVRASAHRTLFFRATTTMRLRKRTHVRYTSGVDARKEGTGDEGIGEDEEGKRRDGNAACETSFLSDIYHASLRALADASACVSATRRRAERTQGDRVVLFFNECRFGRVLLPGYRWLEICLGGGER